jgi:Zn-dependent peptidase ImmA (M78 family)/transcriptional regulator with XRE-family HTH domain
MAKSPVNSKMIELARESRGLTQSELAERIGITQGQLSKIENDILGTSHEYIEQISRELNYPVSFFYQTDNVFQLESFYYRKGAKVFQKDLSQWEAMINVTRINIEKLISNINLPEVNLSHWNVEINGSPQECANALRQRWGIPRGPIKNLTVLAENNGIVVVYIDSTSDIDGISIYTRKSHPLICINNRLSPDRKRFTLAHEIGHLAQHFGETPTDKDRDFEKEAFAFASEFLMPEKDIRPQLSKLNFKKLSDLKLYWKVSMSAIIYRASALEIINDSQSRYLRAQLNAKNWRLQEPVLFEAEKSTLIKEVIALYLNDLQYSEEELAELLRLSKAELIDKYIDNKVRVFISRNASA